MSKTFLLFESRSKESIDEAKKLDKGCKVHDDNIPVEKPVENINAQSAQVETLDVTEILQVETPNASETSPMEASKETEVVPVETPQVPPNHSSEVCIQNRETTDAQV